MEREELSGEKASRTAGEAGWHVSHYNVSAKVPGTKNVAIANLYKGVCAEYTPLELYLLSVLEELDENHPIIDRFAKRGIIYNYDERAALELMGRAASAHGGHVGLTICPTMGCNFDCPYCFESHIAGKMTEEVQDDVVALATRMLDASGSKNFSVTWFGGEPLLGADIIESLSKRFMALVEERGGEYVATIITNGYLLTQDVIDMLGAANVKSAQITLDGVGAAHDATRHLAGGGATFDRIIENISRPGIPFKIHVRHNVHEGNRDQMGPLRELVDRIADETGNELKYYPAPVAGSETADERGKQVGLLCESGLEDVAVTQEAGRFSKGRGHYCGANSLWSVGIDACGRLHKCWEAVDKEHLAFGTAHDWDPTNPIDTATKPDNLTCFLNAGIPLHDDECQGCVWLPHCVGGCPYKRLVNGNRMCVPYKDDPTAYVLALHARIGEDKDKEKDEDGRDE